ncbi:MAG: NADH-quinone oxidoreductase subunit N [Ilumatobacteraceae bacterium]
MIDETLPFVGPAIQWFDISPLLALLGGALLLLLGGALTPQWPRGWYAAATCLSAGAAGVLSFILWGDVANGQPTTLVGGAIALDRFALFSTMTICGSLVLVSLITNDYLHREGQDAPEVYGLYLIAAIGGIIMVSANDLIVLFLGLETLSLSLYVLAASNRRRGESEEAGLKYFILGGFSSAFFLYGVALVFGSVGTTNLGKIAQVLADEQTIPANDALLLVGLALLLVGFAFKVSLVPFQMWTPDVYQGAPTPVTAYLASIGKVAALAALIRVFVVAFPSRMDDWRPVITVLAILTLLIGAVLAVVQTNVKRMLAYSSISHAGFMLVGLEAASHRNSLESNTGVSASLTYLVLYSVIVIGTFGVVSLVAGVGDSATSLDDMRGLSKRRPLLAFGLTVLLLAQAGVPLTSGFVAKFGVIQSAVNTGSYVLAVVAMVSAVIAAFLYLRIMVSMWLSAPTSEAPVRIPTASGLAIGIAVAITLVVGFIPGWLIDVARDLAQFAS